MGLGTEPVSKEEGQGFKQTGGTTAKPCLERDNIPEISARIVLQTGARTSLEIEARTATEQARNMFQNRTRNKFQNRLGHYNAREASYA